MSISEIDRILSKLYDWYYSYDFNKVSEEEKKEIITNKFVELGVFNIYLSNIDDFSNKLSLKAEYIIYDLSEIILRYITIDEKINQLLNNPNIMKFAVSIGKFSKSFYSNIINEIINICIYQNISSDMGVKTLLLLRDVLQDNYFHVTIREVNQLLETVKLKENEAQQADQLIREIRDLSLIKSKQDENYSNLDMKNLIKNISNDDMKIEFILDTLKSYYQDDNYCMLIETINSFDKKLELCRKTVDYQQTVGKKYLKNFMLYFVFEKTVEVNTQEDAQYLISKLKEVMADEKLKDVEFMMEDAVNEASDESLGDLDAEDTSTPEEAQDG